MLSQDLVGFLDLSKVVSLQRKHSWKQSHMVTYHQFLGVLVLKIRARHVDTTTKLHDNQAE